MNVAIVTFISDNYGTCLQAFALQRACEKLGCECTIIKNLREQKISYYEVIYARLKLIKDKILSHGIKKCIYAKKTLQKKEKVFCDFRKGYLKITADNYKSLKSVSCNYDLFITGSDMVWSEEFIDYADFYYLNDVPTSKAGSYAPSFGKGKITKENKAYITKLLEGIRYLSCRENSGVKLINELTGRSAIQVCDPTFLFDSQQWKTFFSISEEQDDVILVNCFGGLPHAFKNSIEIIKEKLHTNEIRFLNSDISALQHEWKYDGGAYGPIEFIKMVNKCRFTIVNGYHGLIFALIFEKPFIVLHRNENEHWSEHENRMKELLEYLNLEDRYVCPSDNIDVLNLDMDYTAIREKIAELRVSSWDYLKKMVDTSGDEVSQNA